MGGVRYFKCPKKRATFVKTSKIKQIIKPKSSKNRIRKALHLPIKDEDDDDVQKKKKNKKKKKKAKQIKTTKKSKQKTIKKTPPKKVNKPNIKKKKKKKMIPSLNTFGSDSNSSTGSSGSCKEEKV